MYLFFDNSVLYDDWSIFSCITVHWVLLKCYLSTFQDIISSLTHYVAVDLNRDGARFATATIHFSEVSSIDRLYLRNFIFIVWWHGLFQNSGLVLLALSKIAAIPYIGYPPVNYLADYTKNFLYSWKTIFSRLSDRRRRMNDLRLLHMLHLTNAHLLS